MKQILPILLMASSTVAVGQVFPFALTAFTESYSNLDEPMSVNNGEIWDDPDYSVPIGFDFNLFGANIDQLEFTGLGGVVGTITPEFILHGLWVYGSDIIDAGAVNGEVSLSEINYQVVGTAPNRIFKLEWKDAAFYNEIYGLGTSNNLVNFQLWLYETSNVIEYRFGPNTIKQPDLVHDFQGKPFSGLIKGFDLFAGVLEAAWLLGGDPTSPVPTTISIEKDEPTAAQLLNSDPVSGQVYRFAPTTVHIEEPNTGINIKAYPTEVVDNLFVVLEDGFSAPYIIRSPIGQEVATGRLHGGLNTLTAGHLAPGLYLLTANGTTVRFFKK